jgi:hypothetical protein
MDDYAALPEGGAAVARHSHRFVEEYSGAVGFGLDRQTDEKTVVVYLQKLSDDELAAALVHRMSEGELVELFDLVSRLLARHLSGDEYHRLFLKDGDP